MRVVLTLPRVALVAALLVTLAFPPSAQAVASNEADVAVGEGGAAAVCQILILVRAVVILDLEDSLALASRPSEGSLSLALVPPEPTSAVAASCDVLLQRVRIVVPAGEAARAGSYVSGPPAVGPPPRVAQNAVDVELGKEGAVAVCQHFLLIDSVIIAGGAHGLPTGEGDGPLLVPSTGGHASCRAELGEVEIVEASAP